MKKIHLYSLGRQNGRPVAIMRKGYTDGTWYYYKYWGRWHIIHPTTGLSMQVAPTLKGATLLASELHLPMPLAPAVHVEKWSREFIKAVSTAHALSLPAPSNT